MTFDSAELNRLHARLADGDPTASVDLIGRLYGPLIGRAIKKHGHLGLTEDLAMDAAVPGKDQSGHRDQGQRVPAADLERLVIDRLKAFFADAEAVTQALPSQRRSAPNVKRALGAAAEIAQAIAAGDEEETFRLLRSLIARAQVHTDPIEVELAADRVAEVLLDGAASTEESLGANTEGESSAEDDRRILLRVAAQFQRAGMEMRFVIDGVDIGAPPDDALVRLLTRAHSLALRLAANPNITLEEAGAAESMGAPYAARLMRLNFLAPDIVVAILNGAQPAALTATKLIADTRLPLAWADQRRALGFA